MFLKSKFILLVMIRISLIGPGNIKYHYFELLKLSKSKFEKHLIERENSERTRKPVDEITINPK